MNRSYQCDFDEIPGLRKAFEDGLAKVPKRQWLPSDVKVGDPAYRVDSDCVSPLIHFNREQTVRHIRNAIVKSSIKIRDENVTFDGIYRNDWIVFDDHAICICSLRSGGIGCVLQGRGIFNDALAKWNERKPKEQKKKELRESAIAKLTKDEQIALGIYNGK